MEGVPWWAYLIATVIVTPVLAVLLDALRKKWGLSAPPTTGSNETTPVVSPGGQSLMAMNLPTPLFGSADAQLDWAKRLVEEIDSDRNDLRKELAQSRAERDELRRERREMRRELDVAQQEVEGLKRVIATQAGHIAELKAMIETVAASSTGPRPPIPEMRIPLHPE